MRTALGLSYNALAAIAGASHQIAGEAGSYGLAASINSRL